MLLTPSEIGCYRRHYLSWEKSQATLIASIETPWHVPAEAVATIIESQGYQIAAGHLARGRWAEVDYRRQVVRVAKDLPARMFAPSREKEVLASSLAHELAHIVLHEGKRPQKIQEVEAWVWARMFLAPWWLVRKRPEVRDLDFNGPGYTERQRWARIYRVAEFLRISPSITRQALELYGVGMSDCPARAA